MRAGDRVKLVSAVGLYEAGSKGIVNNVGGDGYVNVTLDEDENGNSLEPPVPLPPSPKHKFQLC